MRNKSVIFYNMQLNRFKKYKKIIKQIIFEYKIFSGKDKSLACSGQTTQVFLNPNNMDLYITVPPYFEEWKRKNKLA